MSRNGGNMKETIVEQIMTLKNQSLEQLKAKYEEIFKGEKPTSNNKTYLWRKIAYRIQEIELGGLSTAIHARIGELIDRYDPVNNTTLRPEEASQEETLKKRPSRDRRLPIPGTIITKEYKGKNLEIKIQEAGFEYCGKIYKTLTAIAKEVTGAHWNGYLFFNL